MDHIDPVAVARRVPADPVTDLDRLKARAEHDVSRRLVTVLVVVDRRQLVGLTLAAHGVEVDLDIARAAVNRNLRRIALRIVSHRRPQIAGVEIRAGNRVG
ncbi:hypothetical protein D3C80_1924310 [compost metagenome]